MERAHPVGILFADLVGRTQIHVRPGEGRALELVAQCRAAMAGAVAGQGGQVVRLMGDGTMAAFPSAAAALLAAMDIRRAIRDVPPVGDSHAVIRPVLRIGLHLGTARLDADDRPGDKVNLAARVASAASPGQILTTGELRDSLPPLLRALTDEFGSLEIKGLPGPVRLARVTEDSAGLDTTLMRAGAVVSRTGAVASLRLVQNRRSWIVPADMRAVSCGREPGNDILLSGALASRRHATIEIRGDRVVLVDHSTNGSRLFIDDERPVRLLRGDSEMTRTGRIVFGRPDAADADVLHFTVA